MMVQDRASELLDPTICGFVFNTEELLAPLSNPAAMVYDPDPRGMLSAREAVVRYYRDHLVGQRPTSQMRDVGHPGLSIAQLGLRSG